MEEIYLKISDAGELVWANAAGPWGTYDDITTGYNGTFDPAIDDEEWPGAFPAANSTAIIINIKVSAV